MDIQQIKEAVFDVYESCGIETFPISCISILEHYGFKLYSYCFLQKQNQELYQMCRRFSNDAFTFGSSICYNHEMPRERIHFSLMHELGHFLLDTDNETLANQFASHLLAPRIILHKSMLRTATEASVLFSISQEAASYALHDIENAAPDAIVDKKILEHFYNQKFQIYIYHKSECPICGNTIYNSIKNTCIQCKKLSIKSR